MTGPAPRDGIALDAIRECLEGTIPAMMTTVAPDGTPNITYLSQIQYVDPDHVGLSFQFFNKTRANVLGNPHAQVLVIHPFTAAMYRLDLRYLRTEAEGHAVVEEMLTATAPDHGREISKETQLLPLEQVEGMTRNER